MLATALSVLRATSRMYANKPNVCNANLHCCLACRPSFDRLVGCGCGTTRQPTAPSTLICLKTCTCTCAVKTAPGSSASSSCQVPPLLLL